MQTCATFRLACGENATREALCEIEGLPGDLPPAGVNGRLRVHDVHGLLLVSDSSGDFPLGPLAERQQVAVDELGVRGGEAMRKARIVDFHGPLDQLR